QNKEKVEAISIVKYKDDKIIKKGESTMMRNIYLLITILLVMILVACSGDNSETNKNVKEVNAIDVSEFVEITYEGLNSAGIAEYTADYDAMVEKIYTDELNQDNNEDEDILEQLKEDLNIYLDNMTDLSNDDEIILSIDSEHDRVKTTEKTLVVSGLEEPKVLTTEDVEENLDVEFKGINGSGNFKVYNQFDEPLYDFHFPFEESNELNNGDEVVLEKDDMNEDELLRIGYILDENFAPKFEVTGLTEMASTVKDINNYNEIKEEIEEKMRDTKSAYFVEANFQKYDY